MIIAFSLLLSRFDLLTQLQQQFAFAHVCTCSFVSVLMLGIVLLATLFLIVCN